MGPALGKQALDWYKAPLISMNLESVMCIERQQVPCLDNALYWKPIFLILQGGNVSVEATGKEE